MNKRYNRFKNDRNDYDMNENGAQIKEGSISIDRQLIAWNWNKILRVNCQNDLCHIGMRCLFERKSQKKRGNKWKSET